MRALAGVGVFAETEDGRFALTPLAAALQDGATGGVRASVISAGEELYRAWGGLLHAVRTGAPAFDHAYGTGFYDYLARHPEAAATFDRSQNETAGQGAQVVLAAYDFSGIGTLVDVGGGNGSLLAAVLAAYPAMRGILFDRPDVVARATSLLEQAGVAGRCAIVGGDFLESAPAGGDAYILVRTLLNWDEERAARILANCRRAMDQRGRVLVVEAVLPPGGVPVEDAFNDLHLLVMGGGRMYGEAEFRSLFAAAGLALARVVPTPARLSVVEGVAV